MSIEILTPGSEAAKREGCTCPSDGCPLHMKRDWHVEFDEKFPAFKKWLEGRDVMISFIETLLTQQRENIIKIAEGMKIDENANLGGIDYNQALQDLIAEVRKNK